MTSRQAAIIGMRQDSKMLLSTCSSCRSAERISRGFSQASKIDGLVFGSNCKRRISEAGDGLNASKQKYEVEKVQQFVWTDERFMRIESVPSRLTVPDAHIAHSIQSA
jgi:hypothetical protein